MKHKTNYLTIALIVLLVLALGYIALDKYSDYQFTQQSEIYQAGVQEGYTMAIVQIIEASQACQPIPLFYGNVTADMIAVDCLQISSE